MSRKTKNVNIQSDGRDKGKTFLLTEMPASKAEKWAARAFIALAHAGIEIPDEIRGAGMAAIAVIGIRALGNVAWSDAEPLLDEMMECVQIIPDPGRNPNFARPLVEDDIEEVQTRIFLRGEVFTLHTGFSLAGATLTSAPAQEAKVETSPTISTSRRRSAQ